jgi:hypothetical protein
MRKFDQIDLFSVLHIVHQRWNTGLGSSKVQHSWRGSAENLTGAVLPKSSYPRIFTVHRTVLVVVLYCTVNLLFGVIVRYHFSTGSFRRKKYQTETEIKHRRAVSTPNGFLSNPRHDHIPSERSGKSEHFYLADVSLHVIQRNSEEEQDESII